MYDLLPQGPGKLDPEARQFALGLIDPMDLQYGHIADLGVNEEHRKKGVLQHLPYTAIVVDANWWETLGTCNATTECCLHIPDHTY